MRHVAKQGWNGNLFCFTLHLLPPPGCPPVLWVGYLFIVYVVVLGIRLYMCGRVINDDPRLLPLASEGLALSFLSYCFYWMRSHC